MPGANNRLVVGVLGSPRPRGNSDLLLDRALEGAREAGAEATKVSLSALDFKPCNGCNACLEDGECVISDDLQRLYELFDRAEVVIVASPIYFSGLSTLTKMMIDRCQCLWARREVLGRPHDRHKGAFIAVGGDTEAVFRHAVGEMKAFFSGIGIDYSAEILLAGVEKHGDVVNHPSALADAHRLGHALLSSTE